MRRDAGRCAVGVCCCMLLISIAGAAAAAVTHGDLMVASGPDFDGKEQDICRAKVGRLESCEASGMLVDWFVQQLLCDARLLLVCAHHRRPTAV